MMDRKLRILGFMLFFCVPFVGAQVIDLTVLPKAERDSTLVAIVQNFIMRKLPECYREEVIPIITQWNYSIKLDEPWSYEGWDVEKRNRPDYLNPEDIGYTVRLYYPYHREENDTFNGYNDCTASASIICKTGEIEFIQLGNESFYGWKDIRRMRDVPAEKRRLCTLSVAERDSILTGIAIEAFAETYPDRYRDNLFVDIITTDFSDFRLPWFKEKGQLFDGVHPADICYVIDLYYKDWQQEGEIFHSPCIGSVCIVEKNREVCKVLPKQFHSFMEN